MSGARMLAEIFEQPDVYLETVRRASSWRLPARISSIVAIGSGSSFNVALLARHYLEGIAGIPTRVSVASEAFRYETQHPERTLAIALSHSGRSRDVRAAVARAKRQGVRTLAITNIEISPLTRDAELAFVTGAGVELAVPSTKGFTALIVAVLLLASSLKNGAKNGGADRLVGKASRATRGWLEKGPRFDRAADTIAAAKAVIFLGGDILYPVALDGALKLLEITYVPAFAYPPRELFHGPIALVDSEVAVVALGTVSEDVLDAVRKRGAAPIMLDSSTIPRVPRIVRPLVYAPPLQLLAHAVGKRLGRSIDSPRSLTKVVGD
ncbi:MAG: SIS domain-containing protein [Acidobacteria bacterium]|nr:MAG: SIS domain-containing protein [Acidobacteriota bacterium]